MLIDATGARCPLFDRFGFEQQPVLKAGRALGIVCHLPHGGSPVENKLRQSTWSHQYFQQQFKSLHDDHGVGCRTCVYYQQPRRGLRAAGRRTFFCDGLLASHRRGRLDPPTCPILRGSQRRPRPPRTSSCALAIAVLRPEPRVGHALLDLAAADLRLFGAQSSRTSRRSPPPRAERFGGSSGGCGGRDARGRRAAGALLAGGVQISIGRLHVLDCGVLGDLRRARALERADGSLDASRRWCGGGAPVAHREALFAWPTCAAPPWVDGGGRMNVSLPSTRTARARGHAVQASSGRTGARRRRAPAAPASGHGLVCRARGGCRRVASSPASVFTARVTGAASPVDDPRGLRVDRSRGDVHGASRARGGGAHR